MGRKKLVMLTIMMIIGMFSILVVWKIQTKPLWEVNEKRLYETLEAKTELSGKRISIAELAEILPFEWDTLYSFQPYYSEDKAAQIIGVPDFPVQMSVNEGTNQVFFMNKGKVVCYVYGYPEHSGLYIGFGPSVNSDLGYVKMELSKSLDGSVSLEKFENGIWNLTLYTSSLMLK